MLNNSRILIRSDLISLRRVSRESGRSEGELSKLVLEGHLRAEIVGTVVYLSCAEVSRVVRILN